MIARLIGLPRWAQALGGAALLILAFLAWDWWDDRAAVNGYRAGEAVKVQATAAAGATAAASAAAGSKNEVEQANAKARDAAARQPDDPLRAGLDRLRSERHPPQPAPR